MCSLKIGIIEFKQGYICSCSGMFVNCVTHKSWMALSSWPSVVQVAGRTNTNEMYAQHSRCFLPQRMTILTDIFCDSSQSLQPNVEVVPEDRPWPLPSISLSIHYSLVIKSFNAIESELLTALFNKYFRHSK